MARVGPEAILASELTGVVREMLAINLDKIPAGGTAEVARQFLKQAVDGAVDRKLVYLDAKRTIPEENFPKVKEQVDEEFERTELKRLMRQAKVHSRQELEEFLRQRGTNLELEKQSFLERTLGFHQMSQMTKDEGEVTHGQLVAYYREHAADYAIVAKAQWEQLMIRRDAFPTSRAARDRLAWMGNLVQNGAPLAQVAKTHSQGPSAAQGGDRGWTSRGALRSKALDDALFSLPVGQLSPILEDDSGYHIIRVLQRRPAGRVSFAAAQDGMKKKIREGRRQQQFQKYVEKVRRSTTIWTIFDDPESADRLVEFVAKPFEQIQARSARRDASDPLGTLVPK